MAFVHIKALRIESQPWTNTIPVVNNTANMYNPGQLSLAIPPWVGAVSTAIGGTHCPMH